MRIVLTVLLGLSVIKAALIIACYRTAHAQQDASTRVLNAGILILGAPPRRAWDVRAALGLAG
jgi:hypothetical protein